MAVDELPAEGLSSDQIRTREVGPSTPAMVAWSVATAVFVILLVFATYMFARILF